MCFFPLYFLTKQVRRGAGAKAVRPDEPPAFRTVLQRMRYVFGISISH